MARKKASGAAVVAGTAIVVGALAVIGVASVASLAVYIARRVVTPAKTRLEDLRILGFTAPTVGSPGTITLSKTLDTLLPGRYGLWFAEGAGHARIGEPVEIGVRSVTRELFAVDHGDLRAGQRASIAGWFYLEPAELGYPYEDVEIETPVGAAPAWLIPAAAETNRWMIAVHGRGVRRQECLRAVEIVRTCGYNSLLVSYRNDSDAPHSDDRRYGLGDTEWVDVDAALRYAIDHGATEVVLMGWSMGGAISLQLVTRSANAGFIKGIILESPVVNWIDTINYQTDSMNVPRFVSAGARTVMSSNWGGGLTGQATPIDLARLNFVARANELTVPILLMHSADDGFVPPIASRELAKLRPDIVTYDEFTVARHAKLWNYDPARFNDDIGGWLTRLP